MKKSESIGDRLVLKDENGKERIILDASVLGLPTIRLLGEDRSALNLHIDHSNPQIILERAGGKHGAIFALAGDSCTIAIYDKNGYPSIRLKYWPDIDRPQIECFVEGQNVKL